MKPNKKQLSSIALVAALLLSAIGAGGAAVIDTETSVTSTQSEVTDGTTYTDYNGSAQGMYLEANVTSQNPEVEVIDPETNREVDVIGTADLTQTGSKDTGTDGNADVWYYNATADRVNDALQKVPVASGESKSVTIQLVDNSTLDEQNESVTNVSVTLDNTGDRVVLASTDSTSDLFTEDSLVSLDLLGWNGTDKAEYENTNVGINGSGTTVTVDLANKTTADRFDLAATDNGEDTSGSTVWDLQLWTDDSAYKVYYDSAPDSVESTDTYGVYEPAEDQVRVELGDEYDGESSVDVRVLANEDYGFFQRLSNFGAGELFSYNSLTNWVPL